jgi:soluble P-type ATPase
MTLGILEGIPADAVVVDAADDCTKMDVGGVNEVIVSLPVGTRENGAAEVEVVTMTGGMTAAEVETAVVAITAALLETSVAAGDDTGVPVALTTALVVDAGPVVETAEAVDKEPELI